MTAQLKQLLVDAENEYTASWGRFVRKYGKKRALLMIDGVRLLMVTIGHADDREQRRDMFFDIFETVQRLHRLSERL